MLAESVVPAGFGQVGYVGVKFLLESPKVPPVSKAICRLSEE